jgi:lipopolysaccharide transport system permease protein
MYKYRYVLIELIKIELTQNYKKSFLGVTWLFLLPLFQSGIWLFLKWNNLIVTGNIEADYTAFILISTTLWQLYNFSFDYLGNSISTSIKSLIQASIPLFTIVMARFVMILLRFCIALILNLSIILIFITTDLDIIYFLLMLLPYVLFCFGIGILVSMLEVISDDMFIIGKEFNKLLYFITPIFYYNVDPNSLIGKVNAYNPLTYLISIPRNCLFRVDLVEVNKYILTTTISSFMFVIIFAIYIKKARKLIEKIID